MLGEYSLQAASARSKRVCRPNINGRIERICLVPESVVDRI